MLPLSGSEVAPGSASAELENVSKALPLVEKDPRLGYHQEAQCYMYNSKSIQAKIRELTAMAKG